MHHLFTIAVHPIEVCAGLVLHRLECALLLRSYTLIKSELALVLDNLQEIFALARWDDSSKTAGVDVALGIVCDLVRRGVVLAWRHQRALRAPLLH